MKKCWQSIQCSYVSRYASELRNGRIAVSNLLHPSNTPNNPTLLSVTTAHQLSLNKVQLSSNSVQLSSNSGGAIQHYGITAAEFGPLPPDLELTGWRLISHKRSSFGLSTTITSGWLPSVQRVASSRTLGTFSFIGLLVGLLIAGTNLRQRGHVRVFGVAREV